VGVGALTAEFRTLKAPWEDRGDYTDEALRICKELWTSEAPRFDGTYYQFADVQCLPRPVQQPHPPLWIGGNSRRAVRRAAEFGDVWHPSRADTTTITAMVPRLHSLAEGAGRNPHTIGIAVRQPMKIVSNPAHSLKDWPLFGTPQEVTDGIGRFREVGVSHLVLDTFYSIPELAGETVDTMLETMEHFARDVMPHCA
jgi:alkanesulfonate monooxygenase SsuD/methylene tetrahydromethanopterin reductase-like flavin-dependent oxidoreductase (luciferase family)